MAAGCSSLPTSEYVWQGAHLVDVAQTMQIARNPDCYREDNRFTSQLIGDHPSEGDVAAWGIGTSLFHAGITSILVDLEAPRWVIAGWQAVTIVAVGDAVANNFDEGLTPTDSRDCR
jgi:hypothetical protein